MVLLDDRILSYGIQKTGKHRNIGQRDLPGNITGNDLKGEFDLDWRIFHVTLGENKFFKVLFTGKKVGKLHPGVERKIREHFDELSKLELNELMSQYREKQASGDFKKVDIKELKEEYDLWQDKFWLYF